MGHQFVGMQRTASIRSYVLVEYERQPTGLQETFPHTFTVELEVKGESEAEICRAILAFDKKHQGIQGSDFIFRAYHLYSRVDCCVNIKGGWQSVRTEPLERRFGPILRTYYDRRYIDAVFIDGRGKRQYASEQKTAA